LTPIPQALLALEKANEHRMAVAAARQQIAALPNRAGREALALLIETSSDPAVLSGKVSQYLLAIRQVGRGQATRFLRSLGTSDPDKRLRDLTARQRDLLVSELRRAS